MIQIRWAFAGLIVGMLLSTVMIPPTRKIKSLPQPHDDSVYHTETGCVRFLAVEVPCRQDPDSLNLLATK